MFDAAEAYRIGLVQEVTGAGDLLEKAGAIAARVAQQSPLGVRGTIASARSAARHGFDVEAAKLLERAREVMGTEDAAEGVKSFLERRDAVFKGK
ncbi:MAG: enoyl-CoA hydratase-related protein [Polyangiaceae bacterium]